jgi:hypothetical protein
MTASVRTIAIAITAILLMHLGGMAVAPLALHAPASEAAPHHAGHGAVSADDLASVHAARACIETEGVASIARTPLPAISFVAAMPVPARFVPLVEGWAPLRWAPPPVDAAGLRAFLQVFLN